MSDLKTLKLINCLISDNQISVNVWFYYYENNFYWKWEKINSMNVLFLPKIGHTNFNGCLKHDMAQTHKEALYKTCYKQNEFEMLYVWTSPYFFWGPVHVKWIHTLYTLGKTSKVGFIDSWIHIIYGECQMLPCYDGLGWRGRHR